jgi:rhamnopyranosyl-N-acetylglucosaminyl-diphospho-decaprenol beta-1,3/1,4-galactofuranosyltransferase
VQDQSTPVDEILVVDNELSEDTFNLCTRYGVRYVPGDNEFGGAGGFARGMEMCRDLGFEMLWLLDDDGFPAKTCLENLIYWRTHLGIRVVGPKSLDIDNPTKLANVSMFNLRRSDDAQKCDSREFWINRTQFFNGVLLDSDVIRVVGVPDRRLFIRGDEVEYSLRIMKVFKTALISSAVYFHPSSELEYAGARSKILSANVPQDAVKQYYQFRNRGFIVRTYRLYLRGLYDWIRYPYRFLFVEKRNVHGLQFWAKAWMGGFNRDLKPFSDD